MKDQIKRAMAKAAEPVLTLEQLHVAHEELQEELSAVQGELSEVEGDFEILNDARRDTAELVDAADQLRRSNSTVAHEAMQSLLRHNLRKYDIALPSMENTEADAAQDPHKKEETAKATEANRGLLKRMWEALKTFLAKIRDYVTKLFTKRGQQVEVTIKRTEAVAETMKDAENDPELQAELASKLRDQAVQDEQTLTRQTGDLKEHQSAEIDLSKMSVTVKNHPAFGGKTGHDALAHLMALRWTPAAVSADAMKGMPAGVQKVMNSLERLTKSTSVDDAQAMIVNVSGDVRAMFHTSQAHYLVGLYDGVGLKLTLPPAGGWKSEGGLRGSVAHLRQTLNQMDCQVTHQHEVGHGDVTLEGSFNEYTSLTMGSLKVLNEYNRVRLVGDKAILQVQHILGKCDHLYEAADALPAELAEHVGHVIHEVTTTLSHILVKFWKEYSGQMYSAGNVAASVTKNLTRGLTL